jgi:hypothetical protein
VCGSVYNPHRFRLNLLLWIVCCHCPFNIVEDPEFFKLLQSLNANVSIVSYSTLSCDVQEVFYICCQKVASALQVNSFFVHGDFSHSFHRLIVANCISALMDGRRPMSSPLLDSPYIGSRLLNFKVAFSILSGNCRALRPYWSDSVAYSSHAGLPRHIQGCILPPGYQNVLMILGFNQRQVTAISLIHQYIEIRYLDPCYRAQ